MVARDHEIGNRKRAQVSDPGAKVDEFGLQRDGGQQMGGPPRQG